MYLKSGVFVLLTCLICACTIARAGSKSEYNRVKKINQTHGTPDISITQVLGSISTCHGTASVSPHLQHFLVSANNFTGAIHISAPINFEISTSAVGPFSSSLVISTAVNSSIVICVRAAATAPVGYISGNVLLTADGAANVNAAVSGMVFGLPAVDPVADQTVVANTTIPAIHFTGTADQYSWTNTKPAIGLAASGTGDIRSFIPKNNGTKPLTATITVWPKNTVHAYVANNPDSTVSVINTSSNTVSSTIKNLIGASNTLVSHDSKTVYIASNTGNFVAVINAVTNKISKRIFVKWGPSAMALSPDDRYLYVGTDHSIAIIDALKDTVTNTIVLSNQVNTLVASPDGSRVYGVELSKSVLSPASIIILNTATNAVQTSIPVSPYIRQLVLSRDGSLLYLANGFARTLSVINTATMQITSTIRTGYDVSVAVNNDRTRLYLANFDAGTVTVLNANTFQTLATIGVGNNPQNIALTPDGSAAYVINLNSNNVSVISTATNTVTATIPVGAGPQGVNGFISGEGSCAGGAVTFTITVNPAAQTPASPEVMTTEQPGNDINVHQGLSPNGDGVNDFLVIDNIGKCPDNTLSIMNRSGQLIFEAKGYDNSSKVFDGRSNKTGQMQLPGTYFYRLDYTVGGVAKHKTGYLVLKY